MCGIGVIITFNENHGLQSLPAWPFWRGSIPTTTTATGALTSNELLLPLQSRGPNRTHTRTIALPHATLHTVHTVLSLRPSGSSTEAEAEDSDDVFLYNGELYDLPPHISDTSHFRRLVAHHCGTGSLHPRDVDAFRGPWAFVLWHASSQSLYFARDFLGRRSLQLRLAHGQLVIASTPPAAEGGFVEVPPLGIFRLNLADGRPQMSVVSRAVTPVPPLREMRSNGMDAAHDPVVDGALKGKGDGGVGTGLIAGSTLDMYISFLPAIYLRSKRPSVAPPFCPVDQFLSLFSQSIVRRLATSLPPSPCPYAVLFSGGLDSLFIARMLLTHLPAAQPLQLINVAFGDEHGVPKCADRTTAILGLSELKSVAKRLGVDRKVMLVCVDVPPETADESVQTNVRHLVRPCDRPMDATIGAALWHAARGRGYIFRRATNCDTADEIGASTTTREPFVCTAPILFSGLGADELMGGYKGRHRTIFREHGAAGIAREMDADVSRLWFRNLGRDDRLIGSHGKEVRHPFLDEDLMQFICGLPLESVCDLAREDGVGDKMLLRKAMEKVGFGAQAVCRKKRAIQFGSRSKHVIERKRADVGVL